MSVYAMKNGKIRRATDLDVVELTDCIKAAYAKYTGQINDLPDVSDGVAEDISNNLVWVADVDGRVLGGLIIVLEGTRGKLANVAVHPDAAGQGVGRQLLDIAVAECRSRNVEALDLVTHVQMPENLAIYQKLGWKESGRQGNSVFMTRKL